MKSKFLRKASAMVLALTMTASVALLGGCGSNSGSGGDTAVQRDPVQLDVVSCRANFAGIQGGWFGQMLADKFGVTLNIIKGDEVTLAVNLQSGDMGDIIIWGAGGDTYEKAAEKGYLLEFSDSILDTYAPYIKENCQVNLNAMKKYAADGKAYALAGGVSTTADGIENFFYNWDIRWDLYEKAGSPEINTLDDLYNLFVKMKDVYPTNENGQETYAMSLWPDWDGDMVMYAKCLAQAYYGLEGDYVAGLYDNEDGTYYDILNKNGPFLEMVRFLNKLYRAGLLDPNSSTQTYDEAVSKVKADRVFFSLFNYAGSIAYNTKENTSAGKGMYSLVPTEANTIVYGLSDSGLSSQVFSVGSNTEYVDLVLEILNWMYTPEGRLSTEYGPKGLCWDYDENGKSYFTKLGAALHNDQSLFYGNLYSYVDDEGTEHIVAENAVSDGKFTADGKSYDATIYYELPDEFAAYDGMQFNQGTNEMNIVTWSGNSINPESGERFNSDYWASTIAAKATSQIEQNWIDWASKQAGKPIADTESYLQSTDYAVYLTIHDKADNMPTDLKTTYKQITGAKNALVCTGCWNAILSSTEEECEKYIDDMIEKANKFGSDGNTKSYADIVEWAKGQCDARYKAEQDYIKSRQ